MQLTTSDVAEYGSTDVESPATTLAAVSSGESASLQDVVISQELIRRPLRGVNRRGEIAGIHTLASVFTQGSEIVLKRLARLAVELCSAGSAGVSLIEDGDDGLVFRWRALAGEFEQYQGGTTPRDWSPCGECLKAGKPMLYSYPSRYFTYFQKVNTPIVEGLVIPMYLDGTAIGTIWIVSHNNKQRFDAEDVRIMTSLGAFAAGVLRLESVVGSTNRITQTPGEPATERSLVWAEYVRRIAQGDDLALAAFAEETRPLVFSTALKVLSFSADAEEVLSDVNASVWRMAKIYDFQRGSVSAWVLRIARNRAIDRLRLRSIRAQFETTMPRAALSMECKSSVDPENLAASSEIRSLICEALRTLSAEQRRVIEMAYFDGFTMTEIASQLGAPIGTVKTRARIGLIRLRCVLAAVRLSATGSRVDG